MNRPGVTWARPVKGFRRENKTRLWERKSKRLAWLCHRERAARALREAVRRAVGGTEEAALDEQLWRVMTLFAGEAFRTAKGLCFSYTIRGNEMFVNRKDKSITRASVSLAARTALWLQRECGGVRGPKKLGTFGASYLYPVFIRIGVILPPEEVALPLCAIVGRREP